MTVALLVSGPSVDDQAVQSRKVRSEINRAFVPATGAVWSAGRQDIVDARAGSSWADCDAEDFTNDEQDKLLVLRPGIPKQLTGPCKHATRRYASDGPDDLPVLSISSNDC